MTTTADSPETLARTIAAFRVAAERAATEEEAREVARRIRSFARRVQASRWEPYPWQHPHHHPPGWVSQVAPGKNVCDARCLTLPRAVIPAQGYWLQRGGRGTGKTEGAAHYVNAHAYAPPCDPRVPGGHRITIVAPTQADAVASCYSGPSGLHTINPDVTISTNREGTTVRWPNGSVARLAGAHSPADVERLRAWTNVCCAWVEEAAAMTHLEDVLTQLPFTLRLGDRPHGVITTTPKNRPVVTALIEGDARVPAVRPAVVQTWGRTAEADRLHPAVRESLEALFGGTTLGRQELDGEQIGDTPGALWVMNRPDTVDGAPNPDERPGIDNTRVPVGSVGWTPHVGDPVTAPLMVERTVVSVDPPGGRTECGITVWGSVGGHGYLLADLSTAGPPDTWARIVLRAYLDYGAEGIAAEHTYGGDMVTDVLSTRVRLMQADGEWPDGIATPPIFRVPTKVGKRLRAEPVQAIAQQRRLHHVGLHPGVEDEQTTWVPGETKDSPNRLDAYVHGATYLLVRGGAAQVANPAGLGGLQMVRRQGK